MTDCLYLYLYLALPAWGLLAFLPDVMDNGFIGSAKKPFALVHILVLFPYVALELLGTSPYGLRTATRTLESITSLQLALAIGFLMGSILLLALSAVLIRLSWAIYTMGPRTQALFMAKTPPHPGDATASHVKFGMVYNEKENRIEPANCGLTEEGLRHWKE